MHCLSMGKMVYLLYRTVLQFCFFIKLKYSLYIHKRNKSICVQKHLYENVHGSLIHKSPKLDQLYWNQQSRKTNYGLYTKWNDTQQKKKKRNELTTTWMNLNTVLNERSQTRPKTTPNKQTKKTYCTIPFIWSIRIVRTGKMNLWQ